MLRSSLLALKSEPAPDLPMCSQACVYVSLDGGGGEAPTCTHSSLPEAALLSYPLRGACPFHSVQALPAPFSIRALCTAWRGLGLSIDLSPATRVEALCLRSPLHHQQ